MLMSKQMILTVFIVSIAFGTEPEFRFSDHLISVRPQIAHLCFAALPVEGLATDSWGHSLLKFLSPSLHFLRLYWLPLRAVKKTGIKFRKEAMIGTVITQAPTQT